MRAQHIESIATPVVIGTPLTVSDYAALEARWIDAMLADRAGLRRVDSLTGGEVIGRKTGNYAGIIGSVNRFV